MQINKGKCTLLVLLAMVSFAESSTAVHADEKAMQQAMAKAQFMVRQLTIEKDAANQQLAALKKEHEDYQKRMEQQLSLASKGSEGLTGQIGKLQEQNQKLEAQVDQLQQRLAKTKGSAANTAAVSAELAETLEMTKSELAGCVENNRKLVQIGDELTDLYMKKGWWTSLKHQAPVVGFDKVDAENLMQQYRDKTSALTLIEQH